MIEQRTIFLNSKDKTGGNFNNYDYTFSPTDTFFNINENEKLYIIPTRFSILNDYENVNPYNRTMIIKQTDLLTQQETDYQLTLENGIYNVFTLQNELISKMNTLLQSIDNTLSINIDYDDDTNTFIYNITSSSNYFANYELTFIFSSIETTLATLMGFTEGEFIATSTNNSTFATFTSSTSLNMIFQPEINVYCSLVSNNYQTTNDGAKASQLFFTISQNVGKNDMITFVNDGELFKTLSVSQFSTINIRLEDNEGRPILFNSDSRLSITFIKEKDIDRSDELMTILKKIEGMTQLQLLAEYLNIQQTSTENK